MPAMNRFILNLVLSLMLGGCASAMPVPEDRFYHLNPVHPLQVLAEPVLTGGLTVDYVQADPLRSGRAVLYSDSRQPLQLQRYHYEFWVDQPPRMVRQALTSYLREAGVADKVVDIDAGTNSAYRLGVRLLSFEQVLDKGSAGVQVVVEVTLSSVAADTPLWTRVYEQNRASDSPQMYDMASAIQVALEGLFTNLQTDLAAGRPDTR